MKSLKTLIISAAAAATFGAPAFAGPAGVMRSSPMTATNSDSNARAAQITQLETVSDEVARLRLKPGTNGPKQVRYMTKQTDLDDLIDRLKSGRSVSPDEIDRALAK